VNSSFVGTGRVIIIGGGPAGLSAAGFITHHSKLDVLVLDKNSVGQFATLKGSKKLTNHFLHPSGEELMSELQKFVRECPQAKLEVAEVTRIRSVNQTFIVETKAGTEHKANFVLITTGTQLNPIPKELLKYCPGKACHVSWTERPNKAAVYGGSDTAIKQVEHLLNNTESLVTHVHRSPVHLEEDGNAALLASFSRDYPTRFRDRRQWKINACKIRT